MIVIPATVALISSKMRDRNLATGMGLVGTMKNAGKVAGPGIAGVLIAWAGFEVTFVLLALFLSCRFIDFVAAPMVGEGLARGQTGRLGQSTTDV